MTLANIIATGQGRLSFEAQIEGWPVTFGSTHALKRTISDGRECILALDGDSLRWGASCDVARATIEGETCALALRDHGVGGAGNAAKLVTRTLAKRSTNVAYLSASLSVGDTTAEVFDTGAFNGAGVFYVATETIGYTSKDATHFYGLTRGLYGSTAQAHYIPDGAGLAYPRVTDHPESIEGRRVAIYAYGDGSDVDVVDPIWRGIASAGAKYSKGVWSISIDPLTRLLDQDIGGDLSEPVPIRGIRYPSNVRMNLLIFNRTLSLGVDVATSGFFETTEDFCAQVTADIASAVSAWAFLWATDTSLVAVPGTSSGDWRLVYTVGSGGTPCRIEVVVSSLLDTSPDGFRDSVGGVMEEPPTLGQQFSQLVHASFPRGSVGFGPGEREVVDISAPSTDIYLGGFVVPSDDMTISFVGRGDEDHIFTTRVASAYPSTRSVRVYTARYLMDETTRVIIGRNIARGTVATFADALIADSPTYANAGTMPLVTATDILDTTEAGTAAAASALASDRTFAAYSGIRLGDIVEGELKAIGFYQRLNAGSIEWVRLRPALATDAATWTIGERDMARDSWPSFERGQFGIISAVEYKTGWVAADDEWAGQSIIARDVAANSPTRITRTLEVGQHSISPRVVDVAPEATLHEVTTLAMGVFSIFGTEYDVVHVECGIRYLQVKAGDSVALTSSKVPGLDGMMGVASEVWMVIGHTFDASTRRVGLQLIRHGVPFAGWSPGLLISGQSNVAGNVWDLTLTLTGYTSATDIASVFRTGELAIVTQGDDDTPTEIEVTINSFQSAAVARVTFASAWTPGADEWCLRSRVATEYASTDRLAAYAFQASGARSITFSDLSISARQFA